MVTKQRWLWNNKIVSNIQKKELYAYNKPLHDNFQIRWTKVVYQTATDSPSIALPSWTFPCPEKVDWHERRSRKVFLFCFAIPHSTATVNNQPLPLLQCRWKQKRPPLVSMFKNGSTSVVRLIKLDPSLCLLPIFFPIWSPSFPPTHVISCFHSLSSVFPYLSDITYFLPSICMRGLKGREEGRKVGSFR